MNYDGIYESTVNYTYKLWSCVHVAFSKNIYYGNPKNNLVSGSNWTNVYFLLSLSFIHCVSLCLSLISMAHFAVLLPLFTRWGHCLLVQSSDAIPSAWILLPFSFTIQINAHWKNRLKISVFMIHVSESGKCFMMIQIDPIGICLPENLQVALMQQILRLDTVIS